MSSLTQFDIGQLKSNDIIWAYYYIQIEDLTQMTSFATIKFGLLNLNPTIRLVLIKDVFFKKFLLLVLLFIFTSPLNFQLF